MQKSNKILLLTNDHISHFKCSENCDKASLLRSLCSKKAKNNNLKVPTLNQPNIVNGVNAGGNYFLLFKFIILIIYSFY